MQIKRTILGVAGVAALGMGLTAGIASAQDSDSMTTSVNVNCADAATVTLGGNGAFAPIANGVTQHDTQTGQGAIKLTVDMGCYWGPWQVDASISNFVAGPGQWFSGSHFSLEDATVESYFLDPFDGPFDIAEPTASDANFFAPYIDQDTILETQENWFWWWQLPDSPAPFVTTASYTGVLTDLPAIPTSGNYTATLYVTLSLD